MFERSSSLDSESGQIKTKASSEESKSEIKATDQVTIKAIDNIGLQSKEIKESEVLLSETQVPDKIQEIDKTTEISTLEPETETQEILQRANVKQIVEVIEAKVEHIAPLVTEDSAWQERAVKELDTTDLKIEIEDKTPEDFDESKALSMGALSKDTKDESKEFFSVKELVKKHETLVKDQSIDESKDKDKVQDKVPKERKPVKAFSQDDVKFETTEGWETIDTVEFEEPCKLPSPVEQHYSEYSIETVKLVDEDTVTCKRSKEDSLSHEPQYFMDITDDKQPEIVDEQIDKESYADNLHKELRIRKHTDSEERDLKSAESKLETQIETVSEIPLASHLSLKNESRETVIPSQTQTIHEEKVRIIETELSSEDLVACEELESESLEQLGSQKGKEIKAAEYIVPEEFEVVQFEEGILTETAEEEECSAKQSVLEESLEKAEVLSEEILTVQPLEPLQPLTSTIDNSDVSEKDDIENDFLDEGTISKEFEKIDIISEIPSAVSEEVTVTIETSHTKSPTKVCVVTGDMLATLEPVEKAETTIHSLEEVETLSEEAFQRKTEESPVSDEDLIEKASHVNCTSNEDVEVRHVEPEICLEQSESQEDQFQEVFEEKSEMEKEHDSYFLDDNKSMNIRKERVLLSRQESNIEITVAEYNEPFENEYEFEFRDDQYVDHSDSENEYYDRDDIEDEEYVREQMVETESQTDHSVLRSLQALENKEKNEILSDESKTEELKETNIYDPTLASVSEQAEIDLCDKERVKDIHDIALTEEGTIETTDLDYEEDENKPMAETRLHGRVYSDILEYASDEMEGEPLRFSVPGDEEDESLQSIGEKRALFRLDSVDEYPMEEIQLETEDTAKVLEIIEGDEEEDENVIQNEIEHPISACPSERVEFEYGDLKAITSDYDIALKYVDSNVETKPKEVAKDDIDFELSADKSMVESSEAIFQMDDINETEGSEKPKTAGTIPPFVERTEEFIEQPYEDIKIKAVDLGKVSLQSKDDLQSRLTKDFSDSQKTTNANDQKFDGQAGKDMQDEIDDIETDSIEDAEVDSLLKHKHHKIFEPENASLKSSERPLSPTDYTLDVDMDESFIVDKSQKSVVEPEGLYTDVSKQIFIEQSIESAKSIPKGIRQAGDGKDFSDEVPPSPSEYTLVASYDQEMMKKVLQQSPEIARKTSEKKPRPQQVTQLKYEDSMSVSMDESVLRRSLGIDGDRNVMSASYDEEAIKRVYDEEDIMVSSTEHAMQDSLIASSFEPDDYRYTGSVGSGRDEDFSDPSDQGGMGKSYEDDIMTDSCERDSLHRSVGSDSVEQDTVELALDRSRLREQDLMVSSMDQDALQYSLGLSKDEMTMSLDQDSLRQALGLDEERDVMGDSLEQRSSSRSDVMGSSDELKRSLGLSEPDAMGSSDELKKSLGLGDQDILSGLMDIDALHRSLGLASSDSQMETSHESETLQKSIGKDKVHSEVMYDSVEEEALKESLRKSEHDDDTEIDVMSKSMDQESLELSLGLGKSEDLMMASMDQDGLRTSLGLDTIEESKGHEEEEEGGLVDGMVDSMEMTGTTDEHVAEDVLHAKGTCT